MCRLARVLATQQVMGWRSQALAGSPEDSLAWPQQASSPASPVSKAAAGPAGSVPSDPALSQAPGDSAFSSVRTSFASSAYQEALASVCTLPRCQMAELVFSVIFGELFPFSLPIAGRHASPR
ncbi:unnamed protein product [Rangifer tarandus platyrhynchus]|uniref:Uncharacterized protein n=1 Tax=Rangifer tarandus platyrhynchus TaxID=3082113 RepID=A0AC59Z607_RANTA